MFSDVFKKAGVEAAPLVSPTLNLGCGFDVPAGTYVKGDKGQMILNGGLSALTGIAARPNRQKSSLLTFIIGLTTARYSSSSTMVYDSENFVTYNRLITLMKKLPGMEDIAPTLMVAESELSQRFALVNKTQMLMDKWWELCKNIFKVKQDKKAGNKYRVTMPVLDRDGKSIKAYAPTILALDALTSSRTSNVSEISDDSGVDDKDQNALALRDGLVKSRFVDSASALCAPASAYLVMTAQIDDKADIGGRPGQAPPAKALSHMRANDHFKSVGKQFHKLTNDIIEIRKNEPAFDSSQKPLYPRNEEDNEIRDPDLTRMHLFYLRSKGGKDGKTFTTLIASKEEGILPTLSKFDYLRFAAGNYGLEVQGNNAFFIPHLYPEHQKIGRKDARAICDNNVRLDRALEITQELHQLKTFHGIAYDQYLCTPAELYQDLKDLGYDWDVLLDTRGYWTFNEEENDKPELSTLDLLRMRKGEYKPYWMK